MPDLAVFEYDVFISHATEDKDAFVRPLAEILRNAGLNVWYDEFTLSIGDSLSESVNRGLLSSRYGLVVISHAFMRKDWTSLELRSLTSRQVAERRVILPIWLGVTIDEVRSFNLMLSDLLAIGTDGSNAKDLASQILKVVRPDIYEQLDREVNIPDPNASALEAELVVQLKNKIERNLPSNGRGEITAATMREIFMDVVDFASNAKRAGK